MTLPTLKNVWQQASTTIAAAGSTTNTCKDGLLFLINSLTGFSSNPWTVVGSSNGVTAGMDGVNRWSARADLVWNTVGARSWIVLENSLGHQFCISLSQSSASVSNWTPLMSLSGVFTGSSISADPTATDSWNPTTAPGWGIISNADWKCFILHSEDGSKTRIIWYLVGSGQIRLHLFLEKPRVPSDILPFWEYPFIASYFHNGGGDSALSYLALAETNTIRARDGASTITSGLCPVFYTGNLALPLRTTINTFENAYDVAGVYVAFNSSGTGFFGTLDDIWWASGTMSVFGDVAPSSGTPQFVRIGDVWLPLPSGVAP
jgi:hypothetical protein